MFCWPNEWVRHLLGSWPVWAFTTPCLGHWIVAGVSLSRPDFQQAWSSSPVPSVTLVCCLWFIEPFISFWAWLCLFCFFCCFDFCLVDSVRHVKCIGLRGFVKNWLYYDILTRCWKIFSDCWMSSTFYLEIFNTDGSFKTSIRDTDIKGHLLEIVESGFQDLCNLNISKRYFEGFEITHFWGITDSIL